LVYRRRVARNRAESSKRQRGAVSGQREREGSGSPLASPPKEVFGGASKLEQGWLLPHISARLHRRLSESVFLFLFRVSRPTRNLGRVCYGSSRPLLPPSSLDGKMNLDSLRLAALSSKRQRKLQEVEEGEIDSEDSTTAPTPTPATAHDSPGDQTAPTPRHPSPSPAHPQFATSPPPVHRFSPPAVVPTQGGLQSYRNQQ